MRRVAGLLALLEFQCEVIQSAPGVEIINYTQLPCAPIITFRVCDLGSYLQLLRGVGTAKEA